MRRSSRVRQEVRYLIDENRRQFHNGRQRRKHISVAMRIVVGLLLLILVGTLLLMLPIMGSTRGLTFNEAIFTSTSALTVTGLSIITASTDLSFVGQVTLLILIQVGGVGFMFVASLAMRIIGLRVSIMARLALSSSLGLDSPQAILQILRNSLVGIVIVETLGAGLLYLNWSVNDAVAAKQRVFYAIFHAISSFCNAGFDLFNGLDRYPDGIPSDNVSLIITGILIFLGGVGIPVLGELFTWSRGHRWSLHIRVTTYVVVGLILLGWVGYFLAEALWLGVLVDAPLDEKLVRTWFSSISARTAGFAGLPNFAEMRPASQLLTIALMFIGCAPASMGGGITTGTLPFWCFHCAAT